MMHFSRHSQAFLQAAQTHFELQDSNARLARAVPVEQKADMTYPDPRPPSVELRPRKLLLSGDDYPQVV